MLTRRTFLRIVASLPMGSVLWKLVVYALRPAAYFIEVAPEDYQLTTDQTVATHGLIDVSGQGDWQIVPLGRVDGSVVLVQVDDETYRAY